MGESGPVLLRKTEQLRRNAELAYHSKDYSGASTFIKKYNDLLIAAKENWPRGYLEKFLPLQDITREDYEKPDVPKQRMRNIINQIGELILFLRSKI
ncbi:MAG: hypothetical protein M1269_05240 [Chloroflexi bacterium]|nr:hypothetical protein [Chloroflexota bacterium]